MSVQAKTYEFGAVLRHPVDSVKKIVFTSIGLPVALKKRLDDLQTERRISENPRTAHHQIVEDAINEMKSAPVPPQHRAIVDQLIAYLSDETLSKSDQINKKYILEILAAYSEK